ncbi:DNA-binding transcriptional regulator, MarR family [Mycolicibacterium rutilum]|uniref:DNA-binding transcriptional regulator, MarR family n=2 Tax=Mycolicibacterium rutilum TaxID=370526 RepID=A0A1H6K6B7_MYCRU|nr:DNA-binding transcriptional regulator, MarR family [Mycolicibacterium rutilum]
MSTATLMFIGHRAAEARVMEALVAAGADDITLAQSRLMQRLDLRNVNSTGMRLTDLAEQARVTKQTAGALLDQLERSGYVVRSPDPNDARARLVTLSDKGMAVCRAAGEEIAKLEDEWRAHLGTRRFEQLREALLALREITDPYQ